MTEKTNLADIAYQLLKRDITCGEFRPGDKLLMSHLRERYEIGTGPMREALSRLVAEHLVTAASQRGFRVAPMSADELYDIYFARASLEAMIVALAVELGDESWEASVIATNAARYAGAGRNAGQCRSDADAVGQSPQGVSQRHRQRLWFQQTDRSCVQPCSIRRSATGSCGIDAIRYFPPKPWTQSAMNTSCWWRPCCHVTASRCGR